MYVCMCVYIYIYISISLYIYIYIHMYTSNIIAHSPERRVLAPDRMWCNTMTVITYTVTITYSL